MSYKAGFVAILGMPNVGKSTFFNKALGEQLSIVTAKAQTTRQTIRGFYNDDNLQVIFLDAPGFVKKKSGLWGFLSEEFENGVEDGDFHLLMVSNDLKSSEAFDQVLEITSKLKSYGVIWSKPDLEESEYVTQLRGQLKPAIEFVFGKDSTPDSEVKDFMQSIGAFLPDSPAPLYDPELLTDVPVRDLAAEKIRQACFEILDKEIPFGMAILITSFKENHGPKNITHIEANLLVNRLGHKAIVIGKGGSQLKNIGQTARGYIEELLGEKVFLGLHVSHKDDWQKRKGIMKDLGYVGRK